MIDVFMLGDGQFITPKFDNNNIRVHILPGEHQLNPVKMSIQMLNCYKFVRRYVIKEHYSAIMGVDPDGLLLAYLVAINTNIPKWYISLELYFFDEIKSLVGKIYKRLERMCNKRVLYSITQDEKRAELLSEENGVPLSKILLLPNASLGEPFISRSNFLKRRLNIENNRRIILHIGVLADRIMPFEIAESTRFWPEDWVMVFHTRNITDDENRTVKEMQSIHDNRRIKFSTLPVDRQMLPELVGSADVGIAFYRGGKTPAMGKNLHYAGLSGGKIAQYLQNGVPIITNDLPVIADMIREYRCGLVLDDPRELHLAIQTILREKELYAERAVRCFREVYSLDPYLSNILDKLGELVTPQQG
jgi:glycosyltransferase involved in cell wall biosynthesis